MIFTRTRKRGFTLIEIVVAVAIVAVLASVVIASTGEARKKARDEQRKSDLQQMQLALRLYKVKEGSYPQGGEYDTGMTIGERDDDKPINTILEEYMASVPIDPKGSASDSTYEYQYHANYSCNGGQYFVLFIQTLESGTGNWETTCVNDDDDDDSRYGIILGKRP